MPGRLKRIGKNAALSLVAVLVAVALCELAIRTFAPQRTLFPRYVVSEEYPIAFPPNARLVNARGDRWKFVYTTNRLGKRGPFIPVSEARDRTAVVVLGDSFTFGMGVPDPDTYPQAMRRRLGPEYAVVNGGTGGWGIDSEIKWYHRQGRRYDPDHVVLQFTANDPWDFAGVTTVEDGDFRFHPAPGDKPAWQRWLSSTGFIQNSHLYVLARRVYDRLSAPPEAGAAAGGGGDDAAVDRQERYVRMLRLFAEELNREGIRLLFVSVTQRREEPSRYIYDLELYPVIEEAVRRLDADGTLEFVELPLDRMQGHPGSPQGHQWGPEHHGIVGRAIADAIIAGADEPGS